VREKTDQQGEKDASNMHSDNQEVELPTSKDLRTEIVEAAVEDLDDTFLSQLPGSDIHCEQLDNKTDTIDVIAISNSLEMFQFPIEEIIELRTDGDTSDSKFSLHQASAAWRAAAGVALCSPKFRTELSIHPVSRKSLHLFKLLTVGIATDSIEGRWNNNTGKIFINKLSKIINKSYRIYLFFR